MFNCFILNPENKRMHTQYVISNDVFLMFAMCWVFDLFRVKIRNQQHYSLEDAVSDRITAREELKRICASTSPLFTLYLMITFFNIFTSFMEQLFLDVNSNVKMSITDYFHASSFYNIYSLIVHCILSA